MATIYRCDRCGAEELSRDAEDWLDSDQGELICGACQNPELVGTIPIGITLPCPHCRTQGDMTIRIQNPELGPDVRLAHFICPNSACGRIWALTLELKTQET
jgi:hypothetical protein